MQFILDIRGLETADDGNTSYYGGIFTINEQEFYFFGNDRSHHPAHCVCDILLKAFNTDVNSDSYEKIEEMIDGYHYLEQPGQFSVVVDNGNIMVDPIR